MTGSHPQLEEEARMGCERWQPEEGAGSSEEGRPGATLLEEVLVPWEEGEEEWLRLAVRKGSGLQGEEEGERPAVQGKARSEVRHSE